MDSEQRKAMPPAAKVLAGLLVAVFLFLLPLIVGVLEHRLVGTDYMETALQNIGVDDFYFSIYRPIEKWLGL
jgi:hypothetical protein